jgi:hypothetical protein
MDAQKYLAIDPTQVDIIAVRHDLPHMPSLGVSSLDSGRLGNMAASFIFGRPSLFAWDANPARADAGARLALGKVGNIESARIISCVKQSELSCSWCAAMSYCCGAA